MLKEFQNFTLPMPVSLPNGDKAHSFTLRLLTVKERREINSKYANAKNSEGMVDRILQTRIVDLRGEGEVVVLEGASISEIMDRLPAPIYDYMLEACAAMDSECETVQEFRDKAATENFR